MSENSTKEFLSVIVVWFMRQNALVQCSSLVQIKTRLQAQPERVAEQAQPLLEANHLLFLHIQCVVVCSDCCLGVSSPAGQRRRMGRRAGARAVQADAAVWGAAQPGGVPRRAPGVQEVEEDARRRARDAQAEQVARGQHGPHSRCTQTSAL